MQEGQISQANLSEIRRTFKHLDKNEDNKLSAAEFVRGGKIIGIQMTKEEAQDMISDVDTNGSGYIEYEEYEKLMNIQLNKMDKQRAMHLKNFKKYDKDGSGFINFEELKLVLSKPGYDMPEKTIVEHFNKADKNSDGKISFNGRYTDLIDFKICEVLLRNVTPVVCESSLKNERNGPKRTKSSRGRHRAF